MRAFYRASLILLACSDLLSCVFSSVADVALFTAEFMEIWTLCRFMCMFVPFITTATTLCSGLLLVAIALDRYIVIKRAVQNACSSGFCFYGAHIAGISIASLGFAVPLLFMYDLNHVYLMQPDQQPGSELELAGICTPMRGSIGLYYVILFVLIFLPCIVAFLFLNATIVYQLWLRRHQLHQQQQQQPAQQRFEQLLSQPQLAYSLMSSFNVATAFDPHLDKWTVLRLPTPLPAPTAAPLSPASVARLTRHRRMIHVVLLMMAAFLCLRLPNWIFLLMRLYGSFTTKTDWLLFCGFGLLNLACCALNPLFYTFLPQTIRVLSQLKQLLRRLCCSGSQTVEDMPDEQQATQLCCCLQFNWRCRSGLEQAATVQAVAIIELPADSVDGIDNNLFSLGTQQRLNFSLSSASIELSYS
ncbi:CG13575 [Drosophila busckii]|uniref:CG13575 n=2 Tax=Drosophila busckii TaxID=30019 RepID=A0A0M4EF24_DROBS|nr:CG13575 [Drosophila busckii]